MMANKVSRLISLFLCSLSLAGSIFAENHNQGTPAKKNWRKFFKERQCIATG
jgi:hypothetical protein